MKRLKRRKYNQSRPDRKKASTEMLELFAFMDFHQPHLRISYRLKFVLL